MVVIILQNVPASVRGELSRWLLEPLPGTFVGHVNARVRDKLWEKCRKNSKIGGVLQIWNANTEQRFRMRAYGNVKREVIEHDGLQLIRKPIVGEKGFHVS